MANVVLFHSVLGLRDVERALAARWREAGHHVILPDLFDGASTDDLDEGFAIKDHVGWEAIQQRAIAASSNVRGSVVLAGVSMGGGVVSELWSLTPGIQGVLLLHGLTDIPATARPGIPIQLHLAAQDPFFPPAGVQAWLQRARAAGFAPELYRYADAGHYFMDSLLPDHNEQAASSAGDRCVSFLARIGA